MVSLEKNTWSTHLSWTSMLFYRRVWPNDRRTIAALPQGFWDVFFPWKRVWFHRNGGLLWVSPTYYSWSNTFEIWILLIIQYAEIWRNVIWITKTYFLTHMNHLNIFVHVFLHVKKHPMSKLRHSNLAHSFNGRLGLVIWTPTGWSSCPVGRWKRPTRHRPVAPGLLANAWWKMRLVGGKNDEDMVNAWWVWGLELNKYME